MGFFNNNEKKAHRSVPLVKDASGAAATSLQAIEDQGGLNLRKKTEAVTVSLRKRNMSGIRAQVMVLLDHSGSMYGDYQNGKVQKLVDRFLAFGLAVDVDGEIPVIPFDFHAKPAVTVNMSNYSNVVNTKIFNVNDMGSTNLTDALEKARDEAKKTDTPLYVAVVTDGEPNNRDSAKKLVVELANYPVFIKFLAVQPVSFLRELDDLSDNDRLVDNVDTKEYTNLDSVTDEQFADDMADEWDTWVEAALKAGTLTSN